jgi:hypothetical protein
MIGRDPSTAFAALSAEEERRRADEEGATGHSQAADGVAGRPARTRTRLLIGGAILALIVIGVWIAFATGYLNRPIWQT